MSAFFDSIQNWLIKRLSNRRRLQFGAWLNMLGLKIEIQARELVVSMYPELEGERYFSDLLVLHRKIQLELRKQKLEYPHFIFEQGYPYQALSSLGIYGVRHTERRFSDYGLIDLIGKDDRVLDIGCNCGFMLIYTCLRTGCSGDGVDINPYMINIGRHVAAFLGLSQQVNLYAQRFEEFKPQGQYSVIFSFAVHWTDDEQSRQDFDRYMAQLHELLTENGLLVFESHVLEFETPDFKEKMKRQRKFFSWSGSKILFNRQRALFIMRKKRRS